MSNNKKNKKNSKDIGKPPLIKPGRRQSMRIRNRNQRGKSKSQSQSKSPSTSRRRRANANRRAPLRTRRLNASELRPYCILIFFLQLYFYHSCGFYCCL